MAHVGEVDARRLYLRQATPSMFVYCTERLHLSEAKACLRIAAARAARQHPVVLEMLADGRLHLSAVAKLAPHLTPVNRDELLRRATHRTKREIEELVAGLAPRPDVPAVIRKLPDGRFVPRPVAQQLGLASSTARPGMELRPERVDSESSGGVGGSGFGLNTQAEVGGSASGLKTQRERPRSCSEAHSEAATSSHGHGGVDGTLPWVAARVRPAVIEPLSPSRYRVQFTASAQLREKLERLQALMRTSVPDGDLAAVIEAAVTEKLERLEARRFGRTKSPRKTLSTTDTSPRSRHVPAAVRRAVSERDEDRCRYVDADGRRCTARAWIQLHHGHPWAFSGDHSPDRVSLLCSRHNRLMAEIDYGRGAVGSRREPPAGPLVARVKVNSG